MASLESVLDAFAIACDVWLSSGGDEECPTAEFAPLVRQAVGEENAELRELCATVIDDWMSKVCPTFPFCSCDGEYERCTDEVCGNQIYRQQARELGIEVDG